MSLLQHLEDLQEACDSGDLDAAQEAWFYLNGTELESEAEAILDQANFEEAKSDDFQNNSDYWS